MQLLRLASATAVLALIAGSAGIAAAADFDAKAEQANFIAAFNSR
jgi:hypothetical protein